MPELEELTKKLKSVQDELEAVAAKNERLLFESQKNKTRAKEAEATLEEKEKEKMLAEGKTNELLALSREEAKTLKENLATREKAVLRSTLKAEVSKHAKDAHDVDMILKATEHTSILDVGFGDDGDAFVLGAEDFVKKVREEKPYLFSKSKIPPMEEGNPKGEIPPKPKTDFEKYAAEVNAAKNQTEYDAVLKKYGRD